MKKARLDNLDTQITVKEKAKATIKEVDAMGHPIPLVPGVHFTDKEAQKLKTLAKKSVTADDEIADMSRKVKAAEVERDQAKEKLKTAIKDRDIYKRRWERLRDDTAQFVKAIARAPRRLWEVIYDILRQPPERTQPERDIQKSHSRGDSR